jgi:tetratricopeptide (TPR) repeat protein
MRRAGIAAVAALGLYGAAIGAMRGWEANHPVTEYLSVPPSGTLRLMGAGYDNMAANGLYLQFINYFGKHLARDRAYHNMWPVLDVASDLDPRFKGLYQMGAMALGDAGRMADLQALMAKSVKAFPGDWEMAYDAGMAIFAFAEKPEEYEVAATYFKRAADHPQAEPKAAYMLARTYHVAERRDLVVRIWLDLYKRSPNREARTVAARSLERLGVRLPGANADGAR